MQAAKVQVGGALDGPHGLKGLAAGQGQAELLILVGGGDVLVAAGVDAGLQAHHDRGAHPHVGGDALDLANLVHRVDEDPVDACLQGQTDLTVRLVVAVQANARGVHAGAQRERELPQGGGVDAQPLLRHDAGDVGAQEGLTRVEGVTAAHAVALPELLGHRRGPHAGAPPQRGDVKDEGGSAIVRGDPRQVGAAHV